MMIPRVALLTDSDVFAGTERHILELARGLSTLGVEVALACPGDGELGRRGRSAGLRVYDCPKRGAIDWRATLWLRKALRRGEFDLVHVHNGRTALIAAMAARLAGRGVCVATQHFVQPARAVRSGLGALLSRWVHAAVDRQVCAYVATSQAVKEGMLRRREAGEEKISVVYNGVIPTDSATLQPASAVRDQLGITPNVRLVMYVGRLEPEKGAADLIEAMSFVARTDSNVRCVVAGGGSQEAMLRRQVRDRGLEAVVHLIGFQSDVAPLLNAADLVVLPSLAEAFGLALVEAMQFARAVVATRSGGPSEIVEDGHTGLLVPPANPRELARAILRLLADEELRRRMGEAGRRRFLGHFTAQQMAAATLTVYRQALAGAGVPTAAFHSLPLNSTGANDGGAQPATDNRVRTDVGG